MSISTSLVHSVAQLTSLPYSKWPEVHEMKSTTAAKTIEVLQQLFARYGLPEQLVSDHGPQFVAEEFGTFLKQNGVKHIKFAPYHPSSNGLAERFVRTFKEAMKAGQQDSLSMQHRLENFLLMYRASYCSRHYRCFLKLTVSWL